MHELAIAEDIVAAVSERTRGTRVRRVVLDRPLGRCGCGSTDLEWLSGEQLTIKEVEVA